MQTTILLVTLALMAATLLVILRAVVATDGPPPSDTAPKMRIRLLWALLLFGIVLSVTSLRVWPHVSAGGQYHQRAVVVGD